jgi:hypothetical protein
MGNWTSILSAAAEKIQSKRNGVGGESEDFESRDEYKN